MTTSIKIIRYPYEEPHHLNLLIVATNGRLQGQLEFYCNASDLVALANKLELFPRHASAEYLWELGSERKEDRFAHYFRFRLFTTDSVGHCAIQLRFNNNEDLPDREISEFCIEAEPSELNHFGKLIRKFSNLEHEVLLWEPSGGKLYKDKKEAERIRIDRESEAIHDLSWGWTSPPVYERCSYICRYLFSNGGRFKS